MTRGARLSRPPAAGPGHSPPRVTAWPATSPGKCRLRTVHTWTWQVSVFCCIQLPANCHWQTSKTEIIGLSYDWCDSLKNLIIPKPVYNHCGPIIVSWGKTSSKTGVMHFTAGGDGNKTCSVKSRIHLQVIASSCFPMVIHRNGVKIYRILYQISILNWQIDIILIVLSPSSCYLLNFMWFLICLTYVFKWNWVSLHNMCSLKVLKVSEYQNMYKLFRTRKFDVVIVWIIR